MNRPSTNQLFRTIINWNFEKYEVPNPDFKLIALPFLALQRKELFFEMTRPKWKKRLISSRCNMLNMYILQSTDLQKVLKICFCWIFAVKLSSIGWWFINFETGKGNHRSDQENRLIRLIIAIHRLKAKSEEQWTMVSLIGDCFFTFPETVQPLYVI